MNIKNCIKKIVGWIIVIGFVAAIAKIMELCLGSWKDFAFVIGTIVGVLAVSVGAICLLAWGISLIKDNSC